VHFSPLAKRPAFDLDASISNMRLTLFNEYLQRYTKIKTTRGSFSLYIEASAIKGKINGYAKLFIKDLKISEPIEKDKKFIGSLYKSAAKAVASVLKNPQTQAIATQITIKGNIENPATGLFYAISQVLKNAFLEALLPQIDNKIDIKNII
jgi:hypothetical protein